MVVLGRNAYLYFMNSRHLILFLAVWLWGKTVVHGQYQLMELTALGGLDLTMLTGTDGPIPGPGTGISQAFTYFPCGKAYGFEGRGGWTFQSSGIQEGFAALGTSGAGRTSFSWTGPHASALLKLRLHEKHRPKETAFLLGPKVDFPLFAWHRSALGSGPLNQTAIQSNVVIPGGLVAVQIRRPAPEKKSWMFEAGAAWSPGPIFRRDEIFRAGGFQAYIRIGFSFWDQRG